jgi:hypothetical protein
MLVCGPEKSGLFFVEQRTEGSERVEWILSKRADWRSGEWLVALRGISGQASGERKAKADHWLGD